MANAFKYYKQLNSVDCGPTCLRMIAHYYGRHYNAERIRQMAGFGKEGVSLLGVSEAAEKLGFRSRGVKITFQQLIDDAQLPCILHWDQYHFVVLTDCKTRSGIKRTPLLKVADPAKGMISYTKGEFLKYWIKDSAKNGERLGIVLLLEPTYAFYEHIGDKRNKLTWGLIYQYLNKSRWQIFQIFIALLISSLFQLIFPFLTESVVDNGINAQNINFLTIVLVAQLMLLFSRTVIDFIRSRLMLHISTKVNLSILSDFWLKLTRLPLSYFDNHHTGDTLQRLRDNTQLQYFLTGNAFNTIFSLVNLTLYASVLASYNIQLFSVFTLGSGLYFLWVRLFLKIRRKINYETFHTSARENNATLQLVQGMQEIRLNNAERIKRWEWENIQAVLFKLVLKSLTYNQFQLAGALLINQGKDVIITFLAASLVINGKLTFGAMLAIQYIIGQLNSPIEQFVGFSHLAQDAKISLERLNEIHKLDDEEAKNKNFIVRLPENKNIQFFNVSFTYPGAGNEPALRNINLEIPEGKVTAIVGASGSGKTTFLKLLLRFYDNYIGEIKVGDTNSKFISPSLWRSHCGAVMQDGYIFNDTIARNIAVSDEHPDYAKLVMHCKIARILEYIESLPNGFNTVLGAEGVGLSQGQKQRLLIARAIYKNPTYLFFDEATNALDANNEKAIVRNLKDIYLGRTVIIIAHRLSTVKHADKIVVLNQGSLIEEGNHSLLTKKKGVYYELVKNQLELDS